MEPLESNASLQEPRRTEAATQRRNCTDVPPKKRKAAWAEPVEPAHKQPEPAPAPAQPSSGNSAEEPKGQSQSQSPVPTAGAAVKRLRVKGPAPPKSPWSCAFEPREILLQRYSLTDTVLGSGQYGTVRECTDLRTGEQLACKTMRVGEGAEERDEARAEVELMRRVTGHGNVVQLRGAFQGDPGEVHLVMEACCGGELYEQIVRMGRLSEADAAQVFLEISKAVAFCHSQGVVHRDLKPENILLAQPWLEGTPLSELAAHGPLVKLADFGLAALCAPGKTLQGMAGSPFYIAPEVLSGEYTAKADVWSLGVILYILLSGVPPFWGKTDEDVLQAVRSAKLSMSSPVWAGVSAEARSLVKRLLSRDPASRPSAHRILSHPWLAHHSAPGQVARRGAAVAVAAATVPVV